MKIYCCACGGDVTARLTNGKEIYPHRGDLGDLPFWKCDKCGNSVGCHHKTKNRTKPLGVIPSPQIKQARQEIHKILDPLWQGGKFKRGEVYGMIAHVIGKDQYHTAEIRTIEEARDVYRIVREIGATSGRE